MLARLPGDATGDAIADRRLGSPPGIVTVSGLTGPGSQHSAVWSTISASFLLAGLAVIVLGLGGALLPELTALALVMLCAEAFARGHLLQFAAGLFAAVIVGAVTWVVILAAVGNWRIAAAALLALAALVLLLANIRDFFVKR